MLEIIFLSKDILKHNLLYSTLILALYTLTLSSDLIPTEYYPHHFVNCLQIVSNSTNLSFRVSINLLSSQTYLDPNSTNYLEAITLFNEDIEYTHNNKTILCSSAQDSFYIKDNKGKVIPALSFLLPHSITPSPRLGSLGLSYQTPNTSYSIIHQLKQQGHIDRAVFSIVGRHTLYFGGIPFEAKVNKTYSYCDLITEKNGWSCPLTQVSFHTERRELNKICDKDCYATFITDNNKNYAPKAFFNDIIDELFKEEIESHHHIVINKKQIYFFNRNEGILGNATFVIGNYSFTIPLRDFWFCDEDYCDFTIQENPNGDFWILGSDFYRYYAVVFDYDEKQVQFYSSRGVKKVMSSDVKTEIGNTKWICLCAIFVLCLGIGIMATIVITNKNRTLLIL